MCKAQNAILNYLRRERPEGEPVMRSLVMGPGRPDVCAVIRLHGRPGEGAFVGRYGIPDEPRQINPRVVIAHGATWAEVAEKMGIPVPAE